MLSLVSRGHERRGPRNGMDYSDLNAIIKKEIGERSQRIKKKKSQKLPLSIYSDGRKNSLRYNVGPWGLSRHKLISTYSTSWCNLKTGASITGQG